MQGFYHHGGELQDRFDTRRLADNIEGRLVRPLIREEDRAFIERQVLDEHMLAFPKYDGNGMYRGGRRRLPRARPGEGAARDVGWTGVEPVLPIAKPSPTAAPEIRGDPPPLHGGPVTLLRFMRERGMLTRNHARLIARWLWLKLRWRGRLKTDGLCFVCPNVTIEIGKDATLHLGRWSWVGHGTKIRAHEGEVRIGAKTVLGQECTISAFQHVSIGRECIVADRVMLIDFDHGAAEVERPIRDQGIYKRDVRVGHNVWVGYGVSILRGVTVGDNCVLGTSTVVNRDVPANAVAAGVPVRVLRMRDAPVRMRWA